MTKTMKSSLIAPCGINCGTCYAYLRDKNKCPGCRSININSAYCKKCIIRNCDILKKKKIKYCSEKCEKYPCKRLKNLDKRYSTKYMMSLIENLENIKNLGIRKYISNEKIKWNCSQCNGVICVHKNYCFECGAKRIE
ncbi:MAG: DUF3795 domain-containing protein [candidate division Zixibacteria bacterium]|nr:DUF3795 domain-containing protein [candidate division Zixibacteria bacterium]